MARIEVPMPQMGESIAEGTVSVWLKKVGDKVERDEPIMEIATDKVDAEIPSPAAGILTEVVVQEGETVEVGTIVAYIETDVTAAAGAAASAPAPAAAGEPAAGVPGETATTLPEASVGQPETGGGAGAPADGRAPAEDAAPMAPAHDGGPRRRRTAYAAGAPRSSARSRRSTGWRSAPFPAPGARGA
jgi:2-oxoglutarate dehydrogenase E2 component (dihydrolipoamide succinyltransferase)